MFCRFFIDRPIFASVISILIALAGGFAFFTLPLSQYPFVTPPTIQVDCTYPGASAEVVSESIAAPIEQQVNGVEDMLYMSSQSTGDGTYTLSATFKPGTNLNMAQVRVMNRLNLAMPSLPDVVRATGVTTRRRSPEILLTVSLNSPTEKYDQLFISNYALTRVRDEMLRIPGVAEVIVFGQRDYAMRIWLDPDKLAARNLTALDVVRSIREQNQPVPLGQIGQSPTRDEPARQIPLDTLGRLKEPEQYGDVILKRDPKGGTVRMKDVARVALAAKSEDIANRYDRKPTVGLAIFLDADANALATADLVKARVTDLQQEVPEGMVAEIGYDTTPYIRESIRQVFITMRDAVIIVAIVVLIFLRSWRSAIIPLATVPIAIIGTFGAMAAFGYSLNNLTLFGLVLAVGIVVDDAIVVVEAVEHHISLGLSPRDAAIKAMEQVAGPVVAVGAVLYVFPRHRRCVLPAICRNDCSLHDYFDGEFIDVVPGPRGLAPPAEGSTTRSADVAVRQYRWLAARGVSLAVRSVRLAVCENHRLFDPPAHDAGSRRDLWRVDRQFVPPVVPASSHRFHPAAG